MDDAWKFTFWPTAVKFHQDWVQQQFLIERGISAILLGPNHQKALKELWIFASCINYLKRISKKDLLDPAYHIISYKGNKDDNNDEDMLNNNEVIDGNDL